MCLSRSTVNYMVRDLPLGRQRNFKGPMRGRAKGNVAMRRRWAEDRQIAYDEERAIYLQYESDPLFRDFILPLHRRGL